MGAWDGCYSERRASQFKPVSEPAQLVAPANAFQPDLGGGGGVTSVTGDRHDVVAQSAPEWFRATVEALSSAKGGVRIAARKIGTSGKYRFWDLPEGVKTAAQWQAATGVLEAERFERTRPEREASLVSTLRGHRARAEKMGLIVIEQTWNADEWKSAKTVAMGDGGEVVEISGGIDRMDTGDYVFPSRVAGLKVVEVAA